MNAQMVAGPGRSPHLTIRWTDLARRFRGLAVAIALLGLVGAGLLTSPAPVAAVKAVPWRFAQSTLSSGISGYSGAEPVKGWVLPCPSGYTAVSGGVVSADLPNGVYRLLEYPNPATGAFHIALRNYGSIGTAITLSVTCVWLDDVGDITTVFAEFGRNGGGRAGGTVFCPEGTSVLSGGTDWNSGDSDRSIDFSTFVGASAEHPGGGWYTAGYSPVSGDKLNIELRCVASSLVAGQYIEGDFSDTAGPGHRTAKAQCAANYRILTGGTVPVGANPGVDQGGSHLSGPLDARQWPGNAFMESGVTLAAYALCVPASTVSVSFTQTPAALSNLASGTITFVATDQAGETFVDQCYVDGIVRGCSSGSPVAYGPLLDGVHQLRVNVSNQSGFEKNFYFVWEIDATVPTITGKPAASGLSIGANLDVTFSEPVSGVDGASVKLHAQLANKDITGTITRPTPSTMRFNPNANLVPGETYRMTFTSAIKDAAGNSLTATFFDVRARNWVDNTSAAMTKLWDRDTSATASGGGFIVDRLSGAKAEYTFTATAGQTVSVYGVRMPDGGNAEIWLDGVKKATASFYAASTSRARVYLSGALTAGKHTISIRPTGTQPAASSAAWVRIDNVQVGATVTQETALKQYFRKVTAASAHDGSYDQIVQKSGDTTPAQFRVTGVGSGIKVFATKNSVSGSARIYVDGILKATVNLKSAGTVYKALVYSAAFSLGTHTVRVEAVGTATGVNSQVNLDRITFT